MPVILGQDGQPMKNNSSSNAISRWWRWFATSMQGGVQRPGATLVGTFALWCLVLGGISLLAGASYIVLGKNHKTHPMVPELPNPTDAGESVADRIIRPMFRSSTAPSSQGQATPPTQQDDSGLYRNSDQQ